MIIAWMVYTVLVTLLLFAGALAGEFVCRALGWPTRVVWSGALALVIALSVRGMLSDSATTTGSTKVMERKRGMPEPVARAEAPAKRFVAAARKPLDLPARTLASFDDPRVTLAQAPLSLVVLAVSAIGLLYLSVAAVRARRLSRHLDASRVDGYDVFVSDDVGPVLIGIVRPRIVIPSWVLALDEAERRVILEHERQHADARDPALLAVAAILLALTPWNLALWAIFARLRLAIEVDCDARVLGARRDPRRYGDLLVTVYERAASSRIQLAFIERRSNLERRIRRLVDRAPTLASGRGAAALMATVALVAAACETTAPTRLTTESMTPSKSVVGAVPPCVQGHDARAMFEEMQGLARARYPNLFANITGRETVIGLLLDEDCVVHRDTVVTYSVLDKRSGMSELSAAVFGDTTGFIRNSGMTFTYAANRKAFITVVYAVRPSAMYRARVARTPCGIDVRFDERCSIQGPLELRMLDSLHALVAIRGFRATNQPVEDLFLITLARPYPGLATQSMAHGVVAYQSGALYVEDYLARQPLLWFGTTTTQGLGDLKHKRDVTVIIRLVGIAHYKGSLLTLEQVKSLRPASRCEGPSGSCYEVQGQRVEFP